MYADRSHITYYNPISTHQSPDGKGASTLVLTLSNWHFNDKAQKLEKDVTCMLKDCKVSIKLSSESFVSPAQRRRRQTTSKRNDEFRFDKSGLCVDYLAFLGLLTQGLQDRPDFWNTIEQKYRTTARVAFGDASINVAPLASERPPPTQDKRANPSGKGKAPIGSKRARFQPDEDDGDDDDDNYSNAEEVDEFRYAESDRIHQRLEESLLLMTGQPPPPPPPPQTTLPSPQDSSAAGPSRATKSSGRRK